MPKLLRLAALAAVCLFCTAKSTWVSPASAAPSKSQVVKNLKEGIKFHRQATWRWQDMTLKRRSRTEYRENKVRGIGFLRWMAKKWSASRVKAKRLAQNPPRKHAWLCIHKREGPWNDPNAPYYGGLQMDIDFQASYGPKVLGFKTAEAMFKARSTADHWSPLEQIWVAEYAYRSGRGFYPWPNTARACGLI